MLIWFLLRLTRAQRVLPALVVSRNLFAAGIKAGVSLHTNTALVDFYRICPRLHTEINETNTALGV